jgi:hypothetical protein
MEAPQAEMSVVGRMLRVFYAPSETFEAVSEQRSAADWLVPTALVAAVVTVAALLVLPIVTEVGQEAMQLQGKGAAQMATLIATPITMFIYLLITAALFLVLGKLLGGLLSYGQALAIMAYAGLVTLPQQGIATLLISAKKTPEVQMGLGLFLSEEALQSFGGRFLASIDPFLVWWTVLVGLGLSIVGKLDRNRAYIGAIVLSLIWIAGFAGFASLGAAFTPNPNG